MMSKDAYSLPQLNNECDYQISQTSVATALSLLYWFWKCRAAVTNIVKRLTIFNLVCLLMLLGRVTRPNVMAVANNYLIFDI